MDSEESDSFAHTVSTAFFGEKAHDIVKSQINALAAFKENDTDVRLSRTAPSNYDMPPELLAHHAMLFFQCDSKIAAKIEHLKNEHDQVLVDSFGFDVPDSPDLKFLNLWNARTGEFDLYEEMAIERDEKTGFQGAAYYDHSRGRMAFSFGGTDFSNIKNDMLISGGQMMRGKIDNRMAKAIPFTERAMNMFKDRHPELYDKADIDMAGHSVGPNAMALAKYCIETKYGKNVRSQHIVEPAGAINAYHSVSLMIAEAEKKSPAETFDNLTKNARTYKAKGGSFINWFPQLSQNVGDISLVPVKGNNPVSRHLGAAWVNGFMDQAREITQHSYGKTETSPGTVQTFKN